MTKPFDSLFILEVIPELLPYLGATFFIVIGTVVFGSIIGIVLARAKIKGGRIGRAIAETYIYIIRSTPSIILLFMVFYGLPEVLLATVKINCNGLHVGVFVLITFSILFSANMSEVMRSSYLAVDKGQYEAAISIGLSEWDAFRRIVLPQCIVVAIPNFVNALVNLMKEGALAYTIGFIDIMGKGTLIIGNHYGSYALETYIALAIIYWLLTVLIEYSFGLIEKKLSKGRKLILAN